ncbi:hypothetical protein BDP55DRAFT_440967 [Colletotrichum godetiae]|uniref:Uncharacterized protein n=1 Tax=Colletotrichum godetiae TaxID=1209918 RepID=A0AAJ0EQC9_9PEZI|nr:uncharacterized protein BDP55DRAFT_440967 [Colletotrichum godetiae]KAK1657333.1 hypothetical protein BDP55DRAFT_440967 [Colletotrichum godetiae]
MRISGNDQVFHVFFLALFCSRSFFLVIFCYIHDRGGIDAKRITHLTTTKPHQIHPLSLPWARQFVYEKHQHPPTSQHHHYDHRARAAAAAEYPMFLQYLVPFSSCSLLRFGTSLLCFCTHSLSSSFAFTSS